MRAFLVVLLVIGQALVTGAVAVAQPLGFEVQSLDGLGNNRAHPEWGRAGADYLRVAQARYADGIGVPVAGPNTRYVSNRVFNDLEQNLFSERGISQWATTWGQFLDHTFGLRAGGGGDASIPFDNADPLESVHNDLPFIPFERTAAAPGTGVSTPREQPNLVSSYIEASTVYGETDDRLEWLREGPVDGNLANNGARLLLPDRYLPRASTRGPGSAPEMDEGFGGLEDRVAVAGEFRANENIALLATHTLLAREHNRIVGLLPGSLSEEQKFQLARRVVIATQQYITYHEFLPTLGIRLAPYRGYDPNVNASLGNEFATVGYRAHSMLRGDFTVEADANRYSQTQLDAWRAQGITVTRQGSRVTIVVPPAQALFNPDLVEGLQLGPLLSGLGRHAQSSNDEQIDNLVRTVRAQLCQEGSCLTGIFDIGAIDIERGRDHGMPGYNDLRRAYGLAPKASFRAVTGESGESFPADPELTPGNEINDPDSLDFVRLRDAHGNEIPLDSEEAQSSATSGERRTSTAARLKAIYGDVSTMDAFVGMVAEPRVPGTEFGELQLAIWKRQFEALRDGDRFFHLNDPVLTMIRQRFGIDYRRNLGDLIALNTDISRSKLAHNVFRTSG